MAHAFLEDIHESRFTEATIRRMYELVDKAKTDEKFQKLIYGIVNKSMHGDWKNYQREVEVLMDWFKKRHDYRRDPHNVELLQDVWATLDRKRFDCDDCTIFLCAGAEILGAPCRIVTVSTRRNREPSHVYLQAFLDGRWQGVDAIVPYSTVGWEPVDGITARRIWTRGDVGLSGYDEPAMEGLGRMRYLESSNPDGWTDQEYNVGPSKKYEGGFSTAGRVFNPTGISNAVSDSFAPGMPGTQIISPRVTPPYYIHPLADRGELPEPGGELMRQLPIVSHQTPAQLWENVPRADLPMDIDKNVWTGDVPVNEATVDYELPQPYASGSGIEDIAGLGAMVDLGQISEEEVNQELRGLSDEEVEEQAGQLGMLGKRKSFMRKHLALHKKMFKKSLMPWKRDKKKKRRGFGPPDPTKGFSPLEEPMSPLGAFSSLTDSYLSDFEAGNPGYLADADIDSEIEEQGVAMGLLTKEERVKLRQEYRKCRKEAKQAHRLAKKACREQFHVHRDAERLDGFGCCPPSQMSGLGDYVTERALEPQVNGLGAIDWGAAVSSIASNVVSGVTGGAIPANTVQSAIGTAVNYYTGSGKVPTTQQIVTQAPPPTITQKAAFGVGTLVPIGLGLFILSKVMGGGKRRR